MATSSTLMINVAGMIPWSRQTLTFGLHGTARRRPAIRTRATGAELPTGGRRDETAGGRGPVAPHRAQAEHRPRRPVATKIAIRRTRLSSGLAHLDNAGSACRECTSVNDESRESEVYWLGLLRATSETPCQRRISSIESGDRPSEVVATGCRVLQRYAAEPRVTRGAMSKHCGSANPAAHPIELR